MLLAPTTPLLSPNQAESAQLTPCASAVAAATKQRPRFLFSFPSFSFIFLARHSLHAIILRLLRPSADTLYLNITIITTPQPPTNSCRARNPVRARHRPHHRRATPRTGPPAAADAAVVPYRDEERGKEDGDDKHRCEGQQQDLRVAGL